MVDDDPTDPWQALRRFTAARIGLGRAGSSLPTAEILRFGLAHAMARDAVHLALDVAALEAALRNRHGPGLIVHSRAPDRRSYLLRPDLGRRLDDATAARLARAAGSCREGCDLAIVVADGLSALAVQRHAAPLLDALQPLLPPDWTLTPPLIAVHGRVALGDEIGERLGARMLVMLIGERPGLSSPDSLGAYLTWAPCLGRSDAQRNCVSNIRPQGLDYPAAATKIAWLLAEGCRLRLTGVGLKDRSDLLQGRPESENMPP
jgi:ethanolamine ammonia-lyase small subunit